MLSRLVEYLNRDATDAVTELNSALQAESPGVKRALRDEIEADGSLLWSPDYSNERRQTATREL